MKKIKLKNMDLIKYRKFFDDVSQRQSRITEKWFLSKIYLQIKPLCDMANSELENLIKEYGEKKQDGESEYYVLNNDNEKFIEFQNIENNIDINSISLKDLENLNLNIDDMAMLSIFVDEEKYVN